MTDSHNLVNQKGTKRHNLACNNDQMRIHTVKDRIDFALKRAGLELNQSQLARRLGVDASAVNKWNKRPDMVKWENIRAISEMTNVSAPWIKDGKGSPDDFFTDEAAELLAVLNNLEPDRRARILENAKFEMWQQEHQDT